jgi:hypothetical protein
MAYMSQENKKRIVALCKPILAKYDIRATFKVANHSTLICTIKVGSLSESMFKAAQIELRDAMNNGNHDNSDIMSDYFDVGWYVSIRTYQPH